MEAKIKTKRFLLCPHCGESEHQVEHLFSRFGSPPSTGFGPWSCDECDHAFRGVAKEDGTVEITEVEKIEEQQVLCLLRLGDLYVVAGPYREHGDLGWYDYFFHSHQCPGNIMRQTETVFEAERGEDPHGEFRFISAIPAPPRHEEAFTGEMTLEQLFRMFATDGSEAPTEWPQEDHGVLPWLAEMQRRYRKSKAAKA